MRLRLFQYCIPVTLILSVIVGCTPGMRVENALVKRLNNRGPVPLSSQNPYLAANLLVSQEMERSHEIRGFVEHRGAPAAIEVSKGFFHPLVLVFFYPENREKYTLEDAGETWIIRGPDAISQETFRQVAKLIRGESGPPLLKYSEGEPPPTPEIIQGGKDSPAPSSDEQDPFLARLDAYDRKHSEPVPNDSGFHSPSTKGDKKEIEHIIKKNSQQMAEITPKGDVVHYVTYPGETLSMIARWYTKDRANAGRIARINQLKNPNKLALGDMIIVPSYLLQNRNRLTESAVQSLQALAERKAAKTR